MRKIIALLGVFFLLGTGVVLAAHSFSFDEEKYVLVEELSDSALLDTVPAELPIAAPYGADHYYMLKTFVLEGKTINDSPKRFDIQYLGGTFDEFKVHALAHEIGEKIETSGFRDIASVYCSGGQVLSWEEQDKLVIERIVAAKKNRHGRIIRFTYEAPHDVFEEMKNTMAENPVTHDDVSLLEAWSYAMCNLKF